MNSRVAFLAHGRRYTLSLSDSGALLSLAPKTGFEFQPPASGSQQSTEKEARAAADSILTILLRNAKPQQGINGEDRLPGTINYLIGSDPTKWKTAIPTFAKVRYTGIYPGVDLIYYGNQQQLEFDFVVAPGGHPQQIQMRMSGSRRLSLDREGNLTIVAGDGSITLRSPVVYQERNGQRSPVAGSFRLLGRHTVGFALGRYDRTRPLVIDPILTYSTYLGVATSGSANAVAVDAAGNAYVTGSTQANFPITTGALQSNFTSQERGGTVAFVTKFDPSGNVIYSTYLGGSTQDGGNAIAVDASGDAYIAGYTASPDFPVTSGAYQTSDEVPEQPDFRQFTGFITKLNPTGSALVYSTFLGGSTSDNPEPQTDGQDQATSIGMDSAGNAWVAGFTYSTNFPTTSNAVQTTNPAASQQWFANFLTKLNSTGTSLDYSTYLGLASSSPAVTVDASGNAYIAGDTNGSDFPTTPGAYVSSGPGVAANSFIAKFSSSGGAPVYATLVGTSPGGGAWFKAIAVDSSGNAYVTGGQNGGIPPTPGVVGPDGEGAVVVKMNPTGTALVYSTGLGAGGVTGNAIAVDSTGNAYVAGEMDIGTFPVTPDALQNQVYSLENGVSGSFVAKLNSTATAVDYATFLSGYGTNGENAYDCDCIKGGALDSSGNFVVVGQAASVDFPTTPNAFETAPFNFPINAEAVYFLPFVTKFDGAEMTPTAPLTNMNLAVNANPQYRLSNVVFTASLTPQSGGGIPTGSVEFSNDYGPLCNVAVNSTGTATCTTTLLTIGDNPVRVSYYGDQNDSPVTQTTTETINGIPTTTTLSAAQTSVLYGTPVTFTAGVTANIGSGVPTGAFQMPCATASGFVSVDSTGHATCASSGIQLPGSYTLSAEYDGDTNYAQSNSNSVSLTIEPLGVVATPTFSPSGGTYTQAVQASIADTSPNTTIYYTTDGSTPTPLHGNPYGGPISVNQTETIQAVAVVAGYTNSNVASVTYTIPPNFTIGISPGTLTVSSRQSASTTVTITSEFSFSGQVSFSCSGLPAGTSCSFSPATVTGNPQGLVTTTMTVAASSAGNVAESSHWWPAPFLAIAFGAFGLGLRRRRHVCVLTLVVFAGLICLSACSGCGGGSGGGGGGGNQTPVTSTVTVTATSATIQNTATLTVTYTP